MRGLSVLLLLASLTACNQVSDNRSNIDAELGVLKVQLDAVQKDNKDLQRELQAIRFEQLTNELQRVQNYATFDSRDSTGYSRINSPVGTLVVRLKSVEPYLDGFSVTLDIGNPTSAILHGAKGAIKWGAEFDASHPTKLQEKTFELLTDFQSGAWTSVKINIGPATAAQIRTIVFSPEFDRMSLRRPFPPG